MNQVTARWLLDMEEYNEWMNEEDYLIEDEVRIILLLFSFMLFIFQLYEENCNFRVCYELLLMIGGN